MVNVWEFPESLTVDGKEYQIRTDYRVIIDLLIALNDPDLDDENLLYSSYMKSRVILEIMYPDADDIPPEHWKEAIDKACEFIDMGIVDNRKKIKTMDWSQDAPILVPAINKVLNCEIREKKHVHWWTFLGAYIEIGESLFANVVHIRQKKSKGKKLDKCEQEFYNENKSIIDFKPCTQRSEEEKKELRNYFGYGKK